jgi:threonine dehydrogenase-like Zn-dependent dehydrogenase
VFAGLPPERHVPVEAIRVTRDELTIRGVEGNLPDDRWRALRLLTDGRLRARPFVTHVVPLTGLDEAFAAAASGEAAKAVFALA